MITIDMEQKTGKFAENKDVAKEIREKILLPALNQGETVTFNFSGVTGATQSFIHALVSESLRRYPGIVYDNVFYKDAAPEVRQVIEIVYRYMQESM